MKKILGIIVFGLLLMTNAYAKTILECIETTGKYTLPTILQLDMKKKSVEIGQMQTKDYFHKDELKILWSEMHGMVDQEYMIELNHIQRIDGVWTRRRFYIDKNEYDRLALDISNLIIENVESNYKMNTTKKIFYWHWESRVKRLDRDGMSKWEQIDIFHCKNKEKVF